MTTQTIKINDCEEITLKGEGPQGATGSSSGTIARLDQVTASDTWTLAHNFGRIPALEIADSTGARIVGSVLHVSSNVVQVMFNTPQTGTLIAV